MGMVWVSRFRAAMTRSTGHATTASVYTGSQLCYLTPSCKHSRSNPMLRREFITIMVTALAVPFGCAKAQQRPRRIGVLISVAEADPEGQQWLQALLQGLDALARL